MFPSTAYSGSYNDNLPCLRHGLILAFPLTGPFANDLVLPTGVPSLAPRLTKVSPCLFPMEQNEKTNVSESLVKQCLAFLLFPVGRSLVDSAKQSVVFIRCLSLVNRNKKLYHVVKRSISGEFSHCESEVIPTSSKQREELAIKLPSQGTA